MDAGRIEGPRGRGQVSALALTLLILWVLLLKVIFSQTTLPAIFVISL